MNIRRVFVIGVTLLLGMLFLKFNVQTTIAAGTFYVTPDGDDSNECSDPTEPCATIQAAVSKATSGDNIKVSVGTYTSSSSYVALIDRSLELSGGWDVSFTSQIGKSILDGEGVRGEIQVAEMVTVSINSFVLQNGINGILNYGDLTIRYTDVMNNYLYGYCPGGGITNVGNILIEWSNIFGNNCPHYGYGGGVWNYQYDDDLMIIRNSTIRDNSASVGGGIYSRGNLIVINTTISGNTVILDFSNSDGGGMYLDSGTTLLKNVTIAENEGGLYGGGVYVSGGSLHMENSIIANNMANASRDCYSSFPIISQGYNIIGDSYGCLITVTSGDQLDVNPELGALQDNGGPTSTYSMYANSPAIEKGNPAGCTDENGDPIEIDQRGYPRPLDGDQDGTATCDIGAVEAAFAELIPPSPESIWYVSPVGNNSYDCHTPNTACATINGALNKAQPDDEIYVAAGVYTNPTGTEVVSIYKDISLSGGWNNSFTSRSGVSIIDGQLTRRGVLIGEEVTVQIEYFTIQYCLWADFDGGGMYVGNRSRVMLRHMLVQNNQAGKVEQFTTTEWSGGGIAMGSYSILQIRDSQIKYNTATNQAGGIKVGGSTLIITDSVVAYNLADRGGGIGDGTTLNLTNCLVAYNKSLFDYGGGINSFNGILTLKNSLVIGNEAAIGGGGIYGHNMNIENSTIAYNSAQDGGGIYNFSQSFYLEGSSVIGNYASLTGGGIRHGGDLFLVNSTIAYNTVGSPSQTNAVGGGIYQVAGYSQISNGTIARNWSGGTGGGIYKTGAPITLRSTLVADNYALIGPDCSGVVGTAGFNLIGNVSGCTFTPTSGDLTNLDAGLYRLFGNSQAMLLLADSPAIDAGNPDGCTDHLGVPILVDQLGSTRPIDGDGQGAAYCDIGAVEYNPDITPGWLLIPLLMTAMP